MYTPGASRGQEKESQVKERLARLGAAATLVTGLTAGVGALHPAPALAVTCSGTGCTYQDPEASGCSADAVTVASYQLPAVQQRLDLRWSPRCQTNWARMYLDTNPTWLRAVQPDRGDGLPRVTQLSGRSSTYSWSAMIY